MALDDDTRRKLANWREVEKAKEHERRLFRHELDTEPGRIPILTAYRADELATVRFDPRTPLLYRCDQVFLSSGQIVEVFARRGDGKTWLLLTLALVMAHATRAMGFEAKAKHRVLYVDGEMARQDLVERVLKLAEMLEIPLTPADLIGGERSMLTLIAADWQDDPMPRVDSPEGQAALQPYVNVHDVVMFDNRSCLFDPEGEKDPAAWQPAGDYLLSLRRARRAVLLAHHANRLGGARGIGKPEDSMDMVINLARPEGSPTTGARFRLSIDPDDGGKSRSGLWGAAAAPFTVELKPEGWVVIDGDAQTGHNKVIEARIVEFFTQLEALNDVEQLPKSMTAAVSHVKGDKTEKLKVFTDLVAAGRIVQVDGRYRLARVEVVDDGDI
jgi:AAA domain